MLDRWLCGDAWCGEACLASPFALPPSDLPPSLIESLLTVASWAAGRESCAALGYAERSWPYIGCGAGGVMMPRSGWRTSRRWR